MNKDFSRIGQTIGVKIIFIAVMVTVLAIFLSLQNNMVDERRSLRNEAVDRTVTEWGGEQAFFGPFIRAPYRELITTNREVSYRDSWVYLLPDDFKAKTNMKGEKRQRGIYDIPLYVAEIAVEGNFVIPEAQNWIPRGATVAWDKAEACFLLSSARGLSARPQFVYNGKALDSSRAIIDSSNSAYEAFVAKIPVTQIGSTSTFSIILNLKGGNSFGIFPAGRDSQIQISSDQGFPEFGGDFLPLSRAVSDKGFNAEWKIPSLARKLPASGELYSINSLVENMQFASFDLGVAFDGYRLINRALKYGLLFIITPFVGLFLYEIFARRRLHPVQYLLVGFAVVMFYMLLLSLSERMDFGVAFIISGLAIAALIGVYCAAILRGGWAGFGCSAGMSGLYGLLYLIISSEDNALMVGSFFLFSLLALVMVITRRIDWYGLGKPKQTKTNLDIPEIY